MQEILWKLLANGDSKFYTDLYGAGFVSWDSGRFINFNLSPHDYEELRLMSFFDDEFCEFVFSAIAECDELIFKTFDTNYGEE